jgi:hypothetical protein
MTTRSSTGLTALVLLLPLAAACSAGKEIKSSMQRAESAAVRAETAMGRAESHVTRAEQAAQRAEAAAEHTGPRHRR